MNVIYSLRNEKPQRHIGEYFEVIHFKNKYFLYYSCLNQIKLIVSDTLNFNNIKPVIAIKDSPGGTFCIIKEYNELKMLCGCHNSNKEENEIDIPDFVWPNSGKTITDWTTERKDRKNGMYLLTSDNGIDWKQIHNLPVLHRYEKSKTCKLGEIAFDTHPNVVKWKDEYIFFGRLNSSLDERRTYIRKSKDLINWSTPEKIKIINENTNNLKKNYYNFVVFEKEDILYAFAPYFEACGTKARKCKNGCTVLLSSTDAINWHIKSSFLPHLGKYKDIGTPLRKLKEEEEKLLQKKINRIHEYFIEEISNNRGLEKDQVKKIATGEFYLGIEALNLGLVDQLGDKETVNEYLKSKHNIEDVDYVVYQKEAGFLDILSGVFSNFFFNIGEGFGSILTKQQNQLMLI